MNNKEFITELAKRLENTPKETSSKIELLATTLSNLLIDSDQLLVYGFGSFEMVNKKEKIIYHPSGKKLLVPPKRVVLFKPGTSLKEKIKNIVVE